MILIKVEEIELRLYAIIMIFISSLKNRISRFTHNETPTIVQRRVNT